MAKTVSVLNQKGGVGKTTIPRNVRLSEAPSFGQPIIYFDRSSKGAAAYRDFTDEFLAKQSKITD